MVRTYRGYIIPNSKSLSQQADPWEILFPDFPWLLITAGKEALDTTGMINEKCCGLIVDALTELLNDGLDAPVPHQPLDYAPYIEISIDIDIVLGAMNRKIPVAEPN
jgi:hypothetical protein